MSTVRADGADHRPGAEGRDPASLRAQLADATFPAGFWSGSRMRFLWANSRLVELLDVRSAGGFDVLGLPKRGFLSDATAATRFLRTSHTGEPQMLREYEYSRNPAERRFYQLTFLPVPAERGRPADVLVTALDVTAEVEHSRREAEDHRALRRAMDLVHTTILSSLEAEEILQWTVTEVTELLDADWGWIAHRTGDYWKITQVHGWPQDMVGRSFKQDELALPVLASESRTPVLASLHEATPEQLAALERDDIGAFLLVPIRPAGEVSEVVGFCWSSEVRFSASHRELASRLGTSLALALRNSLLYEAQRDVSRELQQAFLPENPEMPGLEVGHLYHSASEGARVGGDFCDIVEVDEGRVGIVMGDVTGRGVGVSALASVVKCSMRAEVLRAASPEIVLRHANEIVFREAGPESLATAAFAVLEAATGRLDYCLAGHPSPVVWRGDAGASLLADPDMMLGVVPDVEYGVRTARVGEGDLLLLYTDGLTEARDRSGSRFGEERLLAAVEAHAAVPTVEVPEALFLDVFSFADGRLEDDIAIAALRRTVSVA